MQMNIFDFIEEKKEDGFHLSCDKKTKLIEFFAGYGSQALALKRLGIDFEHWRISEWAVNSIIAYANLHKDELKPYGTDFTTNMTKEEIVERLFKKGVSINYNEPASIRDLMKLKLDKLKKCYNSIIWSNNLVDISKVNGFKLQIGNNKAENYILTYSFPCQDLSAAGRGAGMKEGSGTRSSLVWQVMRILRECKELGPTHLPNVLLMENVTRVHHKKNIEGFNKIIKELEDIGYTSYWDDLSAVDYQIPQTRNRTFMISILNNKDDKFIFPKKIKLEYRLKHFLDSNVDEKYYLSEAMKKYIVANNEKWTGNNGEALINKSIASTINTGEGSRRCDASNYICDQVGEDFNLKLIQVGNIYDADGTKGNPQAGRVYDAEGLCPTIDTCSGGNRMPKVLIPLKRGYDCEVDMQKDTQDSESIVEIGNYSKSGYNQTAIVEKNGVAPTVMENHGQVTAVVVAGIGEKKSNSGTQWYQQDRIYDSEKVAITVATGYNPWYLYNLRIRKLTPRECARLQGLSNEDYDKVITDQCDSSGYHLFGDSICVAVLCAIFGELYGKEWEELYEGKWWEI